MSERRAIFPAAQRLLPFYKARQQSQEAATGSKRRQVAFLKPHSPVLQASLSAVLLVPLAKTCADIQALQHLSELLAELGASRFSKAAVFSSHFFATAPKGCDQSLRISPVGN
jgi:hypothetical protein